MKSFIFIVLFGIHSTAAMIHSLKYFYTGSSRVPNFPEFVVVGFVDDVQMFHYDSNSRQAVPKQDWIEKNTDPQFWQGQTGMCMGEQQDFKADVEVAKQRYNQTGGVHIVQQMYGCEWDDETDEVTGHWQYGHDGEDIIAVDLKSGLFMTTRQQAENTKNSWEDKLLMVERKNYLLWICPERLKQYVDSGRSSLMRTVVPSVSLLQKTSSSPVSCHATGFYPQRAELMWRKDGEEIHEDVVKGEILPNNDGTFQMTVDLSSVKPEDWNKYECVFQLRGEDKVVTRLEKTSIRSNEGSSDFPAAAAAVVVGGIILVLFAVVGIIVGVKFKLNNTNTDSDTSSSSSSKDQDVYKDETQKMMKTNS